MNKISVSNSSLKIDANNGYVAVLESGDNARVSISGSASFGEVSTGGGG
jgi:hypothetical protein